ELTKVTTVKKYSILTILDWRNNKHKKLYEELSKEYKIEIEVLALITGDVKINDKSVFVDNDDEEIVEELNVIELKGLDKIELLNEDLSCSYYKNSGRFGVNYTDIINLEEKCSDIAKEIEKTIGNKEKILVLGHGENIYIPSRVASKLRGDVYFKSTTRSPIYCDNREGYEIKQKNIFYDEGVKYYFYNKDNIENKYDVVILITENNLNKKL
ncbi:MAG: TRSP domain-containing protein, partial [Clostridium sp.]